MTDKVIELEIPKDKEWLTIKIEGDSTIYHLAVNEISHAIALLEEEN